MPTREQEFRSVRRLLGDPKEGSPSADLVVAQLVRTEQLMANRLTNTGKPWSVSTTVITTAADQAEYDLPAGFGKALYAYREPTANVLVPVPFTDYRSELDNQTYEFVRVPPMSDSENSLYMGYGTDKLAFFRYVNGARVRLYPVPETADVEITIIYAAGAIDQSTLQWDQTPEMPEWSDYRCLKAALYLLPSAEWPGLSFEQNSARRREFKEALLGQALEQESEFNAYIRNPQHEPAGEVGAWYEE